MTNVAIPEKQPNREEYSINTSEFRPIKVLSRVYKPTLRRRRRQFDPLDEGIGIGGYIVRFADGHEHCVSLSHKNTN